MTPTQVPDAKHPRLRMFWKILSISFGWTLILLGILGLFLPILQGWLMIFAGLAVLSPHSQRARRIMKTLKEKLRIHRRPHEGTGEAGDLDDDAVPAERDRKVGR